MLATRIIPTLLCRGHQLIKGNQFNAWRSCGHALQASMIHAMRGVDELVLLDIGATQEGRGPNLDLIRELSRAMFTPLAVGGGIRSIGDVRDLLGAGADKVVICSAGFALIKEVSQRYGAQAVIAAIDVKGNTVRLKNGTTDTEWWPDIWAHTCEKAGAGEILITSIEREGMMSGYDLDLTCSVAETVDIPVIAHGGAGTYQDMVDAVHAGASAVAAGAMFQFTDQTPLGAALYMRERGIEVRIPSEEGAR